MISIDEMLCVFLGGGTGAVCRCLVSNFIGGINGVAFPLGSLTVNVLGSFLIGIMMTFAIETPRILTGAARFLIVVGFLGGFTTFSSFSFETLALIKAGSSSAAIINVIANVVFGLIAAAGGVMAVHIMR